MEGMNRQAREGEDPEPAPRTPRPPRGEGPREDPSGPRDSRVSIRRPPGPASGTLRERALLLVDDDRALVELLARGLGGVGYRVTGFTSAEAALSEFLVRPDEFDAVVSDVSMPRMSGLELARKVLAVRPGVPVVLTSGYVRAEDEAAARGAGVLGFAFKGTFVEEIVEAIVRVLDGSHRGDEGHAPSLYAEPT